MFFKLLSKNYCPYKKLRGWLIFPLLVFAVSTSAQKVSLSVKEAKLEFIFSEIKKQTGYSFVFTSEGIAKSRPVSISIKNAPLKDALVEIFKDQPLSYEVHENYVVVKVKSQEVKKENPEVRGRVVDEDGNGIAGATITVKATDYGTTTDQYGRFILKNINENAYLIISYVGYQPVELNVRDAGIIQLRTNVNKLDEQIIIAYGTTTRRLSTGNVSKIKSEEISQQTVSNPLAALQGRVPGLVVTQSNGLPGASFTVQLRGRSALDKSISDDQPLFVIDGIPYAPNNNYLGSLRSALGIPNNSASVSNPGGLSPFASINPQDIESIEVLKDADATAIYGARGANGVILITTKKGKPGKTTFSFMIQTGISKITRAPEFLSTKDYLQLRHEAFANDNQIPNVSNAVDLKIWDTTRNTDFKKLLIGGTARNTDIQTSISGGTSIFRFLIGAGYHFESTVFPGDLNDQRGSLHFNLSHSSTNLKFSHNLSGSYSYDQNRLSILDLTSFINLPPNFQIYDSSGNLAWNEGNVISNYNNPIAYLNQRYLAKTDNLSASYALNYNILDNLVLRLNAGYNSILLNESQAIPIQALNPLQNPIRSASFSTNLFKSWIIEPQLNFTKQIKHGKIDVLFGSSMQNFRNDIIATTGNGYLDDALLNSLSGAANITANKSMSQYRYGAVFTRVGYNYKNKYLFNLNGRRDGSSKFGPDKRYSNFWSIGSAWIFSEESFLKDVGFFSFGKLRGSIGTTGNDKIINYQYLDTWEATQNPYRDSAGLAPVKLFNPNYRWEKTTKMEVALDVGILDDRLLFSAAYYRNRSSNQLIQYSLPATTGFANVIQNMPATVENTGLEVSASSILIRNNNFRWSTALNVSFPRNRLISFPSLSTSSYASRYVVGEPLNLIYRYKFEGIDPTTGIYKVRDVNADGVMNTWDYTVSGSIDPKWFGGWQNTFHYQNISLDLFLQFTKQKGADNTGKAFVPGMMYNMPDYIFNRWQKSGDVSTIQKLTRNNTSPAYIAYANEFLMSDGIYEDASFLRLKNVSLSWTHQHKNFGKVKIYLIGQNLFTITSFGSGDPETQSFLKLPPLRTLVGGIQFNF